MEQASHLGIAHHDPSVRWLDDPTPEVGETVRVEVEARGATTVTLRTVRDGEAVWHEGSRSRRGSWVFRLPCTQAVVDYRFLIEDDDGDRWLTAAGEVDWDPPDLWDFKLLTGRRTPSWVPSTVWYQIFPDRFATTGRYRPERSAVDPSYDWARWCDWDAPVASGRAAMAQMYGGDLDGVVERLDHLVELGIGGIYLTPVFPARSSHRYDATSFDRVDPILGGDDALVRLSREASDRGIRVIGDLTLNHTGNHHEWFEAATADATSVEAGWYHFIDHPDRYEAWFGVRSLPKLDHRSESLRSRLYEGPDSVVARYLRPPFDLAGWRIDVANMIGRLGMLDLNRGLARAVRATMDDLDPELWLVAEHFHDAIADTPGDGWHGVMNYAGVGRPIASWLGRTDRLHEMTAGPGVRSRTGRQAARAMDAVRAGFPWQVTLGSMSLLASHDTARWRSLARSDELALVGVGLLMMLPGAPTFFYGDEIGLTGDDHEAARRTMPWDRSTWDHRFLDWYRSIIAVRNEHPALGVGGFRWIDVRDDALTFLRETSEERLLVRAARGATPPIGLDCDLLGTTRLDAVLGADDIDAERGMLPLPADGPALSVWRLAQPE